MVGILTVSANGVCLLTRCASHGTHVVCLPPPPLPLARCPHHRYTSLCPLRVRLGPAMSVLGSMHGEYTCVSGDTGGKSVKVAVPKIYFVLPPVYRLPAEE